MSLTPLRRPMLALHAAVLVVLCTSGVYAQSPRPAAPSGGTRAPAMQCRDLRASSGFEYSIDSAAPVPAKGDTPEFCQVLGLIQPEVRFELSLPRAWNRRLYMFGNGGYAGENLAAGGRVQRRDAMLAKGFAVVQTNTGHDAGREPLGSFALTPQKLADYAYRAVHVSALAAKGLARTYYGGAPDRSYFEGCSTGGRQGLISAQRFPDDFDGIVVGAPVLDFSGTIMHYQQVSLALREAPGLAKKMELIASRIYAKCDATDGLKDGLIDDPRRCQFDPAADLPACAAGPSAECLTPSEIAGVQAVYRDLAYNGTTRFPGFPIGAEIGVPTQSGPRSGWDPWIVTGDGQPSIAFRFMETFYKYMVTPGREIDWTKFDASKDADQMKTISAILDATDADLGRFRTRGGKIVMYYGWADPALNPMMGVNYYERVRDTMGASTPEFFRLFMMPGVFHCAGGVGPDRADMLTPLMAWVENGTVPDRIIATKQEGPTTVRSRPLCPYPQVAKHNGSGSIDDAASFACAAAK